jgi:hypothetical protein
MIRKISLEVGRQYFGPGFLDRVLCFRLRSGNLDPPLIASLNQSAVENETSKISQSKRPNCEQPYHQSISEGLEPA